MDDGPSNPSKLQAGVVPVTPLQQNCTIVWDRVTLEGAVIDPGGDVDNIMAALDKCGADIKKPTTTTPFAVFDFFTANCLRCLISSPQTVCGV